MIVLGIAIIVAVIWLAIFVGCWGVNGNPVEAAVFTTCAVGLGSLVVGGILAGIYIISSS